LERHELPFRTHARPGVDIRSSSECSTCFAKKYPAFVESSSQCESCLSTISLTAKSFARFGMVWPLVPVFFVHVSGNFHRYTGLIPTRGLSVGKIVSDDFGRLRTKKKAENLVFPRCSGLLLDCIGRLWTTKKTIWCRR
jgi:hypothetical protein